MGERKLTTEAAQWLSERNEKELEWLADKKDWDIEFASKTYDGDLEWWSSRITFPGERDVFMKRFADDMLEAYDKSFNDLQEKPEGD